MDVEIRPEQPADYGETEHVTREAFWNQYSPGCSEHYLLHIMRDSPDFVAELDFVALDKGRIVGNVVCLKTLVQGDDGNDYEILSLGPISVLPEYQRRGIGGRLIEQTRCTAREMRFCAILLYGDPAYYSRHGFVAAETQGIRTADDMYAAAHQVCVLYENALDCIQGRHLEHDIYAVDATLVEEFDARFPAKEKISGTPSQQRFEELLLLRRSALQPQP